jgi:hypothetical protein
VTHACAQWPLRRPPTEDVAKRLDVVARRLQLPLVPSRSIPFPSASAQRTQVNPPRRGSTVSTDCDLVLYGPPRVRLDAAPHPESKARNGRALAWTRTLLLDGERASRSRRSCATDSCTWPPASSEPPDERTRRTPATSLAAACPPDRGPIRARWKIKVCRRQCLLYRRARASALKLGICSHAVGGWSGDA